MMKKKIYKPRLTIE